MIFSETIDISSDSAQAALTLQPTLALKDPTARRKPLKRLAMARRHCCHRVWKVALFPYVFPTKHTIWIYIYIYKPCNNVIHMRYIYIYIRSSAACHMSVYISIIILPRNTSVSRRSLTWILVQRRRPCVAAFAASLCGVGDLIGRRNVHKGNHTTKWSDSTCISGYIW